MGDVVSDALDRTRKARRDGILCRADIHATSEEIAVWCCLLINSKDMGALYRSLDVRFAREGRYATDGGPMTGDEGQDGRFAHDRRRRMEDRMLALLTMGD